jgi:hypothetical protein
VASKIVAAIEKSNHVSLGKRLIAGGAKVGWNACKVEVDPVLLGNAPKPITRRFRSNGSSARRIRTVINRRFSGPCEDTIKARLVRFVPNMHSD